MSEQPKVEEERTPEEEEAVSRRDVQPQDGAQEVPLFLRGRSDGPKWNAQDEKDEVGE